MPARIRVTAEQHSEIARIRVEGELDVETVGNLDAVLRDVDAERIEVDLGAVTFCDTRGLECIVRQRVATRDEDRVLALVDRSEAVDRLLGAANLNRFFDDDQAGPAPMR